MVCGFIFEKILKSNYGLKTYKINFMVFFIVFTVFTIYFEIKINYYNSTIY